MTYSDFKNLLKKHKLKMTEFSSINGTPYKTCQSWAIEGRKVPPWVESWFKLYGENKNLKEVKNKIKKLAKEL